MIGQILKIPFPYVQKKGFKVRPAVVLNQAPGHMICAAISSTGVMRKGDVYLEDWRLSGLVLPSKVKIMILTTFSSHNLQMPISKIGILSERDFKNVLQEFRNTWGGGMPDEQSGIAI